MHVYLVLCRMWARIVRKLFVVNLVLMLLNCKRCDSCALGRKKSLLAVLLFESVPRCSLAGCCQTGPWPATFGGREIAQSVLSDCTGQKCIYSHFFTLLQVCLNMFQPVQFLLFSQWNIFFFPPFWKKRFSGIALNGKKGHFSLKAISYKSFKQGLNFVQIHLLPVYDACH